MDLQVTEPTPIRADDQPRRGRMPSSFGEVSASKVPEITAYFWIAKGLTTGMG